MSKKRLLDGMVLNPARFYRAPGDVLRDRRFGDSERLEILRAWRDSGTDGAEQAGLLMMELEQRLTAHDHAAE